MTGPVTRWLRRPASWTHGLTVFDVLVLAWCALAAAAVLAAAVLAATVLAGVAIPTPAP